MTGLLKKISIDGITSVKRDHAFDDEKFRSGGIRLHYPAATSDETDLKEGVLLELGFDDVTPTRPSSRQNESLLKRPASRGADRSL